MDERCHNDLNQSSPYDSGSGINYNRLYSSFVYVSMCKLDNLT